LYLRFGKIRLAEKIFFVLCDHLPAHIDRMVLSSATIQYRAFADCFIVAAKLLAT
jgi:hypothetical protein